MIEKFFRQDIKNFKPYEVGEGTFNIKLDANESFIEFPLDLKEQIASAVINVQFNRYPDPDSKVLCKLYSEFIKVDEKNIIAGNGSDELVQIIVTTFLDKGDKLFVVNPDFSMYQVYAEIRGGKVVSLDLDKKLKLDVDLLIDKVAMENPKILILSNPNNPTGGIIPEEDIIKVIENCNCIVIIDEAYVEFYGKSVVNRIKDYDNLIVLRTCSKALGSAGLRLGFLITNEILLKEIKKVKPPFNVNSISQAIGVVILKNRIFIEESISRIIEEKNYLYEELNKIEDIKTYPTEANFILIETYNADKINRKLIEKGIKVRKFNEGRLENCLRINAGSREENEAVLGVLRETQKVNR